MIFEQAQVRLAHRSRPTLPPSWQMDLKQRWIDILDLLLCQFVGQRLPVHASLHRRLNVVFLSFFTSSILKQTN
ncbi:Pescadillo [Trichinella spiralis]|uniref:Pescadillo n=1 Tax=Trichinella spiralis TaxID=6334 RepID=A0ABR3K2J6_TRISP